MFIMPNTDSFDAAFISQYIEMGIVRCRTSDADGRKFLHGQTLAAMVAAKVWLPNGGGQVSLLDIVAAKNNLHGVVIDRKNRADNPIVTECVNYLRDRLSANGCAEWFDSAAPRESAKRTFGNVSESALSALGL